MATEIDKNPNSVDDSKRQTVNTTQTAIPGVPVQDIKVETQTTTVAPINPNEDFMLPASKEDMDRIRALTEEDILTDAIVAKDLKLPSFLNARPKDPIFEFRWVRRLQSKLDGSNRYEQMKAIGFTNALPDDIDGKMDTKVLYQDGAVVYQDVILMKIRKDLLYGYYKKNVLAANRNLGKDNAHKEAMAAGQKQFREAAMDSKIPAAAYKGKVSFYVPPSTETE